MKDLFFNFLFNSQNKSSYSYKLRKKRFERFIKELDIDGRTKILDVGGAEATWSDFEHKKNVTILNVNKEEKSNHVNFILGDACNMAMFQNNSFDVIYSNSVLEHVGKDRQIDYAREICRVSKRFWIQTPNKFFPLEPHFLFPFFQFMPYKLKIFVGMKWKYSHLRKNRENIIDELNRLNLLSIKELRKLFPNGKIIKEKIFFFTKSFIVYL